MSIKITIETKSGKHIDLELSEAREVHKQLEELFSPKDRELEELKKACEEARGKIDNPYTMRPMLKPIELPDFKDPSDWPPGTILY